MRRESLLIKQMTSKCWGKGGTSNGGHGSKTRKKIIKKQSQILKNTKLSKEGERKKDWRGVTIGEEGEKRLLSSRSSKNRSCC